MNRHHFEKHKVTLVQIMQGLDKIFDCTPQIDWAEAKATLQNSSFEPVCLDAHCQ